MTTEKKLLKELRELANKPTKQSVARVAAIMEDKSHPDNVRLEAAKLLLEWEFGPADEMTEADRREFRRRLRRKFTH